MLSAFLGSLGTMIPILILSSIYEMNENNIWVTGTDGSSYSMADSLIANYWVKPNSEYDIIFSVMFIITAITLVSLNLLNTLESPEFITYMGQSINDIMIMTWYLSREFKTKIL